MKKYVDSDDETVVSYRDTGRVADWKIEIQKRHNRLTGERSAWIEVTNLLNPALTQAWPLPTSSYAQMGDNEGTDGPRSRSDKNTDPSPP